MRWGSFYFFKVIPIDIQCFSLHAVPVVQNFLKHHRVRSCMIRLRPLLIRLIFGLMGGGDRSGQSGVSKGGGIRDSRAPPYSPMAPLERMKSVFVPPLMLPVIGCGSGSSRRYFWQCCFSWSPFGSASFSFLLGRIKWDKNDAQSATLYIPSLSEMNTYFLSSIVTNLSAVSGLERGNLIRWVREQWT